MKPQYSLFYHAACNYLVAHGGYHGNDRERAFGRKVIARALWDLRKDHGRERAALERRILRMISGQFPVKPEVTK